MTLFELASIALILAMILGLFLLAKTPVRATQLDRVVEISALLVRGLLRI